MRAPLSRALFCLAALLLLLCTAAARADGYVFPTFDHRARIPDQQALIAYKDGLETLAIETRFFGTGTDFAWVVPLPAPPEISPATTGLFPSLRAIFAPEIKSGYGSLGFALILVLLLGLAISFPKASCLARILAFAFLLLLFSGIFLPTLGSSRGIEPAPGITIVDRQVVGSFETTTIAGASADPLLAWLKESGFEQPPEIKPVLADYIAHGWCFVATKLRRDAQSGTSTPHPLVFRFPSPAPIYPLKLTGVSGKPVTIELYIFGPGTAQAPGFTTVRSFQPDYEPGQEGWRIGLHPSTTVTHSTVAALAAGAPVATCLKGTLSPGRMSEDATITFGPPTAQRAAVYSRSSAWAVGFDAGMSVLFAGTVLIGAAKAVRKRGDVHLLRPLAYASIPAAIVCVSTALALPKAPATTSSSVIRGDFVTARLAGDLQTEAALRDSSSQGPITIEWARARIAELLEERRQNSRTEFRIPIEEDSPGNYTIRATPTGLEFRAYSMTGGESVQPLDAGPMTR